MREAGGTGLGLSISKRIMELHGGTINIRSEVGKGSAFTLLFPPSLIIPVCNCQTIANHLLTGCHSQPKNEK